MKYYVKHLWKLCISCILKYMDVILSLYRVNLWRHEERKSAKPNIGDNFKSTVIDLPLPITLDFTDQNSQQQHEFCDEILNTFCWI
jgi:hypothetical protein